MSKGWWTRVKSIARIQVELQLIWKCCLSQIKWVKDEEQQEAQDWLAWQESKRKQENLFVSGSSCDDDASFDGQFSEKEEGEQITGTFHMLLFKSFMLRSFQTSNACENELVLEIRSNLKFLHAILFFLLRCNAVTCLTRNSSFFQCLFPLVIPKHCVNKMLFTRKSCWLLTSSYIQDKKEKRYLCAKI